MGLCVHLVNNSDAGESLAADSEDEKLQRGECSKEEGCCTKAASYSDETESSFVKKFAKDVAAYEMPVDSSSIDEWFNTVVTQSV